MGSFVVKILPFLLMFGLIAPNVADESRPMHIKNINGNHSRTQQEGVKYNITEEGIQFAAGIERGIAQNVWFASPLPECYKRFFVCGQPPTGLRTGPNNLQRIRYICQLDETRPFYSTMFDEGTGIAVLSAYKITRGNARFATRASPGWSRTAGINLQGRDAIYHVPYDKGHLAPGNTLGSSLPSFRSTFQYTNAVPQERNFNRGSWRAFEDRIRHFALQCTRERSTLFLLTGTSFVRIRRPNQVIHPMVIDQLGQGQNAIRIPFSMWTAGCCVSRNSLRTRGFAVIGNNVNRRVLANRQNYAPTKQVTVAVLQQILGGDVSFRGIGSQNVNLFPSDVDCLINDLGNLPRARRGR